MKPCSLRACLFLFFLAFIFPCYPASATEVREITWEDLLPTDQLEFDDPFEDLTKDQLRDLGMVARFRNLLAREAIDPDGESARNTAERIAGLKAQGIDVDWILSQRERVIEQRKKRAEEVDAGWEGKKIRIPGYVLPLREDKNRITEFLLVPWVGACIHTPPPPPNQMIHVSIPDGMKNRGRFIPFWIEGEIVLKPAEYELFLVDGSANVKVSYTMTTDNIAEYSAKESDILAQVKMPVPTSDHSWLQNIEMRVSMMFTKSMSNIGAAGSSGPLLTGLLVAFLYGFVHTLGPGHGKSVVISYFIGEGGSLGRGVVMGTKIAIFHVLSAIVVVWITDFTVRQATGAAPSDYRFIKLISYASIMAIGCWMLWKAIRALKHTRKHDHHHEGCSSCAAIENGKGSGAGGWLALAVGSVPCTGALLVLLFGMANDLLGPAILIVIMISFGMAVAMSGIGILALMGRRAADRKFGKGRSGHLANGARLISATAVFLIGFGLFLANLNFG